MNSRTKRSRTSSTMQASAPERQVAAARRFGAQTVAHGCTGKGNDQVRFELTYAALAPDLRVIAPWREAEWTFRGREDLIAYLKEKGIPTTATLEPGTYTFYCSVPGHRPAGMEGTLTVS